MKATFVLRVATDSRLKSDIRNAEKLYLGVVMKKIGDLMAELGFKKEASDSVKEAFIKHLIKNTTGINIETPSEKKEKVAHAQPEQLTFDFFKDQSQKEKAS